MRLFGKKKPEKTQLEALVDNNMHQVLRDARRDAGLRIKEVGEAKFFEEVMNAFDETTVRIPYNMDDVEYRVMGGDGGDGGDVVLYFRVKGNGGLFKYLAGNYKIKGTLGLESKELIYLHYRAGQFTRPEDVLRLFYQDVDTLRAFLQHVHSLMEPHRNELRLSLTHMLSEEQVEASAAQSLEDGLKKLGFSKRAGKDA